MEPAEKNANLRMMRFDFPAIVRLSMVSIPSAVWFHRDRHDYQCWVVLCAKASLVDWYEGHMMTAFEGLLES